MLYNVKILHKSNKLKGEYMNIKVSVIIPVYNSERYLKECIESLLQQELTECEFIFVNNASKDKSYDVIKKYERLDNRIKVINQDNRGVSVARNTGLQVANGEYIGFVDSDDTISKDYFYYLYNAAKCNEVDIIFSRLNAAFPFEVSKVLDKKYIEKNIYPFLIKEDSLNSVCNKLYRADLIKSNNIKFPEGIALGEDGRFNISAFTYANNVMYVDYCGYNYREVQGSATRNILEKDYFQRSLQVYEESIDEVKLWNVDSKFIDKLKSEKLVNSVLAYTYAYFDSSNVLSFKDRYSYVKNMINNSYVRNSFKAYKDELYKNRGIYEKTVLKCIEKGATLGVYFSTLYSRVRNS